MPALSFGLKGSKGAIPPPRQPPKRKAAFDEPDGDGGEGDDDGGVFGALQKSQSKPESGPASLDRSRKSPKLSDGNQESRLDSSKYTNLSALRNAKLQDEKAAQIDASVYDYDAVYETFSADKEKKKNATNGGSTVPKYMTNLLASAEVRKRDQLKAKEKALQKERDAEGDAFADKEKFVTEAYKKQQEEIRKMEEEEKKRDEEEEERRRKGGGMTAFHKDLLQKDEERQRAVEEATRLVQLQQADVDKNMAEDTEEKSAAKMAAELNEQGASVVVNDDGEVVDKRQLLTAGLNVAPTRPGLTPATAKASASAQQDWQRSSKQQDARVAQRERQSRMMERQLEEIAAKQKEAELAEQKELEDKNKSKLTDDAKLSAKERYLQRKKEREEEAKKAKAGTG